jgi:hypothetical protein
MEHYNAYNCYFGLSPTGVLKLLLSGTANEVGRATAQALTRWPLHVKDRVRARVTKYGVCGGQSGTETGFYSEFSGFPLSASFHRGYLYSYCASPGE